MYFCQTIVTVLTHLKKGSYQFPDGQNYHEKNDKNSSIPNGKTHRSHQIQISIDNKSTFRPNISLGVGEFKTDCGIGTRIYHRKVMTCFLTFTMHTFGKFFNFEVVYTSISSRMSKTMDSSFHEGFKQNEIRKIFSFSIIKIEKCEN